MEWWTDLLTRHGWRDVSRSGLRRGKGIAYFQRPGKVGREPSATYGATGTYLYVFSSNALTFEPDTAYSAFSAYTLLEHAGNFTAAARALVAQGYGDRRPLSLRHRAVSVSALLQRSTLRHRAVNGSDLLAASTLRETAVWASEVAPWH
jgi:hypothetical protein